jgi:mannitol-1-/sugar-/sorbitol-6-/2-deoxyglucose-6-phosphatase
VIHSGQDEPYGKPHPGGYIRTAEKLGLHPTECVVFEDSLNGVLSAKAARMKCIAVPEYENIGNPKFAIADKIVSSLSEVDKNIISQF